MKKEFKEECWLLYGYRVNTLPFKWQLFVGYQKYHASGTADRVVMDYETSSDPRVIGWYHTHPGRKNVTPSATDLKTMRSWVKAFYRPYLCGIRCGSYSKCYYYFVDGMTKAKTTIVSRKDVRIKFFGSFFLGIVD